MDGILSSCVSDGNNLFICETSSIPAICRQTLRKVCGYCELIRNGIFSSEEKEMPTQCNCPVRGRPVVRLGQKRGLSEGSRKLFFTRCSSCGWNGTREESGASGGAGARRQGRAPVVWQCGDTESAGRAAESRPHRHSWGRSG